MSKFTDIETAVLQTWLGEAQQARHALLTGAQVVSAGYGDKRTTFTQAQSGRLDAYIDELNAEIAARTTVGYRRRRGVQVVL